MIKVHSPLSTKFSTFLFSRKLNFIIEVTIDCIAQKHPEVFGKTSGDPVASSCGLQALTTVLSLMHAKAMFEV